VTAPKGAALKTQIPTLKGIRYDYLTVAPSTAAGADFMLVDQPTARTFGALSKRSIGLAMVRAPSAAFVQGHPLFRQTLRSARIPTVLVDIPEVQFSGLFEAFADELSHNQPLDLALFGAARIFRGAGSHPPILLMPRNDAGQILSGVRPQAAAQRLRIRLDALPRDAIIGRPPDFADAIGIGADARTVDDYLTSLSLAIDQDRLIFVSENHAQALSLTTNKVESLEDKLAGSRGTKGFAGEDLAADSGARAKPSDQSAAQFSAYTRLNAPDTVTGGVEFEFDAGFGAAPDPKADSHAKSKIDISDAKSGEDMLVVVAAEHGTIVSPENHSRLALRLDAKATFRALPEPGAPFVRLSAEYFFRNELAGMVAHTLAVAGRPPPEREEPEEEDLFWPTMVAIGRESVDLTLMVKLQKSGNVTWQAIDRASGRISKMLPVTIGDAKGFAGKLGAGQKQYGDKGFLAQEAIKVTGQLIGDLIPQKIQDEFLRPLLEGNSPPRVLILTNEPFIPWELALLDPQVTGKTTPQFLGASARVGRWWVANRVPVPPLALKVGNISAVAADSYELQTNRVELPQAKAERDWLHSTYKAQPVQGRLPPVVAWLKTLPIGPGHLAHFALHGYVVPQADEQVLILGDGGKIDPGVLAGLRLRNQDPRFGMVFLNACQVGMAGQTLGQIAGFPGELLRAGTGAVIGPLWEVNDVAAHEFAKTFYGLTFNDAVGVSEALRQLREKCDGDVSVTPLAYIYYGHPGLTLSQ
jgi:hypothetical protein